MRILKADLEWALAKAAEFNQLPLVFVRRGDTYSRLNFIPVCQYGRGMLPLRGEIGTMNGTHRYIMREER